ncbi:MAG: hypothetical protein J6W82_05200 [Bacteroidales bacterium]|nr:hypothetical protein [Bacteroidales bacterium]
MPGKSKYVPSILQRHEGCYLCWRTDRKLDRHEVFPGAYRQKSKEDGLWVLLCHEDCHEGPNGVQYNAERARKLKKIAQLAAMKKYGWTIEQWRERYGKDWT